MVEWWTSIHLVYREMHCFCTLLESYVHCVFVCVFTCSQLAVFRILFGHWKDFCELRMKLGEDKVLPTVERLRRHAKAREKQKQAELEQRLEQVRISREHSRHFVRHPFFVSNTTEVNSHVISNHLVSECFSQK